MSDRITLFFVAAAVGVILGCNHRITVRDAWYRPPPGGYSQFQGRAVACEFMEVAPAHQDRATTMLLSDAVIPLGEQDAHDLATRSIVPVTAETHPFLIRALAGNPATGRFQVLFKNNEVLVYHGSLGHSSPSIRRTPLVVWLPSEPHQVYVALGVAE